MSSSRRPNTVASFRHRDEGLEREKRQHHNGSVLVTALTNSRQRKLDATAYFPIIAYCYDYYPLRSWLRRQPPISVNCSQVREDWAALTFSAFWADYVSLHPIALSYRNPPPPDDRRLSGVRAFLVLFLYRSNFSSMLPCSKLSKGLRPPPFFPRTGGPARSDISIRKSWQGEGVGWWGEGRTTVTFPRFFFLRSCPI